MDHATRNIAECDGWAVGTDGIQWILRRQEGARWRDVSFVRTTKDILERCMEEKGCPPRAIHSLLEATQSRFEDEPLHGQGRARKTPVNVTMR